MRVDFLLHPGHKVQSFISTKEKKEEERNEWLETMSAAAEMWATSFLRREINFDCN